MRHATTLTALAVALLSFQCSSTSDTALVRQQISLIKAWHLEYTNSPDPTSTLSGQDSPVFFPGQVARNLRFAEVTSEFLRTRLGIPVSADTTAGAGHIRLTAIEPPKAPPKYFDVAIFDPDNRLLARTRIWNDSQAMIATWSNSVNDRIQFNENLAAYLAERLADLLAGKQTENRD
jgi:hypothetical protein